MPTINKVFVDSSRLIDVEKRNYTKLLQDLYFKNSVQLCINDIVVSQFFFHFIGLQTGKASLIIKEKKEIASVMDVYIKDEILTNFQFIPSSKKIVSAVPDFMNIIYFPRRLSYWQLVKSIIFPC